MTTYTSVFGGDTVPPSDYAYRAVTLATDTTFSWPDNSDGPNLIASIMDVNATVANVKLILPAGNEVSDGRDILIRNVGAEILAVRDNGDNAVATVAPGEGKYFYLTDNTTVNGTWAVFTYGTGTSGADATALAGKGLTVLVNKLNQMMQVVGYGPGITLTTDDRASALKYVGGAGTWYLPDPASVPNGFFFTVTNTGSGTLTIDASTNGGTIDSINTKLIQPGESAFVIGDSTAWITVGYGRSTEFAFTQLAIDASTIPGGGLTITSAQAANKLWYFYNTAGGDRIITIPSVASVYFLRVGAIGAGNELTFTTGSGATVTLTANQSYTIYCDGTNVVAAQTVAVTSTASLDDGSASTPSLSFSLDVDTGLYRATTNTLGIAANGAMVAEFSPTGLNLATPLAVTEGGTGATDAATARANLGAQAQDADLDALAALSTTGLISRTGSATFSTRTLTAPPAGITVSNGDGVSGNPTLALNDDLAAVEALTMTGVAARTGTNAWAKASVAHFASSQYAADSGSANAYAVTLDPVPSNYVAGMTVYLKPANANSGASTIDVNSLGVKDIRTPDGLALGSGALNTSGIYPLTYNGTYFVIGPAGAQGPQGDAATIAVGTVTTGAAGSSATVTNVGTSGAAIFDFTIPRGDTGATGPQGPAGVSTTYTVSTQTATGGQTVFNVTYTVGYVDVYQNGARLIPTTDFTASNGTTVVLATGATVGDEITFVVWTAVSVANALTAADIGVSVQGQLVSGTNIKTVGGQSLLGSGDIAATPTLSVVTGTSQSAAANTHYVLTNGSATTVTLPASPADGDIIWITVANALTTNIIARNGKEINGVAEDMTIDNAYATVQLRYIDSTRMWRVL